MLDTIVIASTNKDKIREFQALLPNVVVKSLLDYPDIPDVDEPYDTFVENAKIKSETISRLLNVPVIADDSGLCVDALDGKPGVHSARWGGSHRDYISQNQKLLTLMTDVSNRNAHYNTTIALSIPGKTTVTFEGIMPLTVAYSESETPGFSYDTVVKYNDVYVSELSLEEKNLVSSRSIATNKLLNYLTNTILR